MQLHIYVSTTADGSMKVVQDGEKAAVAANRMAFLRKNDILPDNTTDLRLLYDGGSYTRYLTLEKDDRGDGITRPSTLNNDAVVAAEADHAILLPLADCIGAVLHDPARNILMVSHLGRHNLEQNGGYESVRYLVARHNVDPTQLKVWLSPAAGKGNYPLRAFNGESLHAVAIEQLTDAGVPGENIETSPIDTTTDESYFSHSEFLKGNRKTDGRFAVVAVMRSDA